jgi:hypothetical protein
MMTMTTLSKGTFGCPTSSLAITVHKIQYQNKDYVKFRGTLTNKMNGIFYETKNYKLYFKNISHWERL